MVEGRLHLGAVHAAPPGRGVAGLAPSLHRPRVGVLVAVGASAGSYTPESKGPPLPRSGGGPLMAVLTRRGPMPAGEGIGRVSVVEAYRSFPLRLVVAVRARLICELLAMGIVTLMAGGALRGKAEERPVERPMLGLERVHVGSHDPSSLVAVAASGLGVFSFQRIPHALVLERQGIKAQEVEVSPQVLLMTGGTLSIDQ